MRSPPERPCKDFDKLQSQSLDSHAPWSKSGDRKVRKQETFPSKYVLEPRNFLAFNLQGYESAEVQRTSSELHNLCKERLMTRRLVKFVKYKTRGPLILSTGEILSRNPVPLSAAEPAELQFISEYFSI